MASEASQIIARIEAHVGLKIEPRRLRFHVIENLQREIDQRESMVSKINAVIGGFDVFDPNTHKPIRRSKSK